jgi:SAM-dependent methyltransferase
MEEVKYCPSCNSNHKKPMFNVPDRHYGIKGFFTYSACQTCGLVFLDPMPSETELMAFYPEDTYYSYSVDIKKEESSWKGLLRKILFLDYKTKDPYFSHPGAMLDIGCGNGWFIYTMRSKGWDVKGVEPSKTGADAGRKSEGLDIHQGDLLSAGFPSDSFDYIRSNHSFEHIPNPNEVLAEIHRILKPSGKVFIGVPNINSYNANLFGNFWYYLGAPVHTFNYSSLTLPSLIEKHNFKNVKIQYNSNYNGILGSIQIWLNQNSKRTSHQGFVINFFPFKVLGGLYSKISNWIKKGDCIEIIFEK